jgi:hypothetical protein
MAEGVLERGVGDRDDRAVQGDRAALFDGITLDAHHAVASDGFTHEVVNGTF